MSSLVKLQINSNLSNSSHNNPFEMSESVKNKSYFDS